jgi:hypothetical protein
MRQLDYAEDIGALDELEMSRRLRRVRRVPYDYVAKFVLQGDYGYTVQSVINISAEATFVCTSIGYSLEEPDADKQTRLNIPEIGIVLLDPAPLINLRESLSFTYSIIDKGSGRELQNQPIHNLAGLGRPDGTRPFRELAVPYVFAPNSSVLIEIREIVTIRGVTIHMDFQGYKEFR